MNPSQNPTSIVSLTFFEFHCMNFVNSLAFFLKSSMMLTTMLIELTYLINLNLFYVGDGLVFAELSSVLSWWKQNCRVSLCLLLSFKWKHHWEHSEISSKNRQFSDYVFHHFILVQLGEHFDQFQCWTPLFQRQSICKSAPFSTDSLSSETLGFQRWYTLKKLSYSHMYIGTSNCDIVVRRVKTHEVVIEREFMVLKVISPKVSKIKARTQTSRNNPIPSWVRIRVSDSESA